MKKWQSTIINHHDNAIIVSDTQIKIPNIGYSTINNESYDEIVTREDNSYFVETFIHDTNIRIETHAESSIAEYLGY
jgi:imidazoleglycerol phosphate synthase glutamine amidotransferase subunit HisH